ncbi:uncharacterized protein LOC114276196 [Camellia sinensis]|uniref:uncharacterized protein LOC114276196 n=1 Tax=Camellia sinensis TaxID=4442 RepID=UPI0010366508|nr:uncharacterized protein LOC114276196 [Camellia sinensis]
MIGIIGNRTKKWGEESFVVGVSVAPASLPQNDFYCIMNNVILWNPIIKKSLTLPLPRTSTNWLQGPASQVIGFGFDPKTIDYKVLKLTYFEEGLDYFLLKKPPFIELYSLRLGSWTDIGVVAPMCLVHYNSSQAFVDGTINWVPVDKNRSNALILLFDLRDEVFGELNLPESLVKVNPLTLSIAEFRKSVVVCHEPYISSSKCFVWVKEYVVNKGGVFSPSYAAKLGFL